MPPDQKPSTRPVVWVALLVTCGLVYWQWSHEDSAQQEMPTTVLVPERTAAKRMAAPSVTVTQSPLDSQGAVTTTAQEVAPTSPGTPAYFTRQLPAGKVSHALFVAHEWLPPPPKPQPPPPPEAPPLPYSYVGSMQEVPGGDRVILMQQKKVLLPKLGSQVSMQWRLDREDAQAVYFTYLPLNKPVVLSKTKTAAAGQRRASADADNNYPEEMLNQ